MVPRMPLLVVLSLLAVSAMLLFPGCGGGGGDGAPAPPPTPGAPVVNSLAPANANIWPGEQTTVTASASHPQNAALTYEWTATGGQISGSGAQVTWTAPTPGGVFTIKVTVKDASGREATREVTVTAGATVSGRVVDAQTGQPLANVQIKIDQATGATDSQGRFTIVGVGRGTHTVTFVNFDFVQTGPEVTVNVTSPGTVLAVQNDIPARDLGGSPPPPPFNWD